MHCTYPPSPPVSPPWQRSPDCSVISTPAQPYSFLIQILVVVSFSLLPPFSFLLLCPLFLFLLGFPRCLSLSHTHPQLSFSLTLSDVDSCLTHTHAHTHNHSHSHTSLAPVIQTGIHLTLFLSLSLPPSLCPSFPLSLQDTAGRS